VSGDSPDYEKDLDAYLAKVREDMTGRVVLVREPDGTLAFGFRCWPDHDTQAILDAVLDGLAANKGHRRGVEIHGLLIEPDVRADERDPWAKAWRLSDRTLVAEAPLTELALKLQTRHQPRTRG
jgi:hypothetical protein